MSDPKFDPQTDRLHPGGRNPETQEGASRACAAWEVLLPEAAEGLLSDGEQKALDAHILICGGCAWELADAQRGAAWMGLLKGHAPEPPAGLLLSILEKTSGTEPVLQPAVVSAAPSMPSAVPLFPATGARGGVWGRLERWLNVADGFSATLQPRLAMTSAMAFLSLSITFNLLGVSARNFRVDALRPGGLQRIAADTSASLVRSFEGIRVVYRVESRVNEWRTASAAEAEAPLDIRH